ncbi:transmembrane channel-like protein 7 isoform X1 [Ischnura elegans]|uniref:transmembrane channel-like protein 7 isoform X1 n=2 Tax=Ischnura elegans TaxID=197161 RepID=UPI001ED8BCBE|nr:transmembrane channel-like protein 7 isoform X1 [Ischnura elegans]
MNEMSGGERKAKRSPRSVGGGVGAGGGSGGPGGRRQQQGWEEAGSEFYQESYPAAEGGLAGADGGPGSVDALSRDPASIATLLPSKQMHNTLVVTGRRRGRGGEASKRPRRRPSSASAAGATRLRGGASGAPVAPTIGPSSSMAPDRRGSMPANEVHAAMLPDFTENLSNEERTWEEIMQIKALPVCMAQKRELKARLQNATKLRLQGLEQFNWRRRKWWRTAHARWKELRTKLAPWRGSLKHIEGRHGTGVLSYFLFLRWLVFLNLTIFLLVFSLVVLPTLILGPHPFGSIQTISVVPDNEQCPPPPQNGTPSVALAAECCSKIYLQGPRDSGGNFIIDIVQGTGWLERTLAFYGFYDDVEGYDLPLAYVAATLAYFLVSLAAIVKSAAAGFKERLVEGEGGRAHRYCHLVFSGWDFCIDNETAAITKHRALYNEMRACLRAEKMDDERRNRTRREQFNLALVRISINAFVFCVLGALGFVIYGIFKFSREKLAETHADAPRMLPVVDEEDPPILTDALYRLLLEFLPYMAILLLNFTVPYLFAFLVVFERYSPLFAVRITLLRTVFLRLSSLGVLLASFYSVVSCSRENHVSDPMTNVTECFSVSCATPACWETFVGQQFYKLVILDFSVHVAVTLCIHVPRALLARRSLSDRGEDGEGRERRGGPGCFLRFLIMPPEFDLPSHVLDAVYSQTLCWLGTFYCPLLPMLSSIASILSFYVRRIDCHTSRAPSSLSSSLAPLHRASRTHSLFMAVLLLSLVASAVPIGYALAETQPSLSCGPFRGRSSVWETVSRATTERLPSWLRSFVSGLITPTFAVPAFAALALALCYFHAVSTANRDMVNVLRRQLVLEGHDKQFLLNRLSAFVKQHQQQQLQQQHQQHLKETAADSSGASAGHSSNP